MRDKEKKVKEVELANEIKLVKLQHASTDNLQELLTYHNKLVDAINEAKFSILYGTKKYEKLWKMLK
jgi:hypothetical protein